MWLVKQAVENLQSRVDSDNFFRYINIFFQNCISKILRLLFVKLKHLKNISGLLNKDIYTYIYTKKFFEVINLIKPFNILDLMYLS